MRDLAKNKQQDDISPWEALNLDRGHPNKEQAMTLQRERSRRFKQVFDNDAGRWVLEYLNGLYFDRQIVNPHDQNVLVSASIRQGEQNLLRQIHMILNWVEE